MENRVLDRPGTITQNYGVINSVTGNKHFGTDIVPNGVSECYVWAHSDGEVIEVENNHNTTDTYGGSYGNFIVIRHSNGYATKYCHLKPNSIVVSVGDIVKKGTHIATTGNTGRSTGIHLHFEVMDNLGIHLNSDNYLNKDLPNMESDSEIKVGDKVLVLSGRLTADSYGGGSVTAEYNGGTCPNDITNYLIVTDIVSDRPRPVHLRRTDERGGTPMGWASYEQITKNY